MQHTDLTDTEEDGTMSVHRLHLQYIDMHCMPSYFM